MRIAELLAHVALAVLVAPALAQEPVPRLVDDVYRPGELAHWKIEGPTGPMGWHATRYDGPTADGGGRRFSGWLELDTPQVRIRSSTTWITDPAGSAIAYTQATAMGDARARIEISFVGDQAVAEIVQGGSTRRMSVRAGEKPRILANNYVAQLEFALRTSPDAERHSFPFFSPDALTRFPYRAERVERDEEGIERWTDSLGESLWIRDGRLVRLEAGGARFERTDEPFEPFDVSEPRALVMGGDFDVEEVRLVQDGVELAGFLTRPHGTREQALPGIFFLSGSGAQDRHGFSGGIDIGTHEILDRLTLAGFAVLRVDDRGTGASSAPPDEPSLSGHVEDARRCVEYLRARDDVDASRIFLVGHSEGAVVAGLLARDIGGIAGLVSMAAPGRPLVDIMVEQNRDALADTGLSGEALERRVAEVRAAFDRLVSEHPVTAQDLEPAFAALLPMRRWLQEHARVDLAAALLASRVPVLLTQGSLDMQVSLERDARALDARLREGGHPDHRLVVFERLDHLFKEVPGERSKLADYFLDRRVDAAFLRTVEEWLIERAKGGD